MQNPWSCKVFEGFLSNLPTFQSQKALIHLHLGQSEVYPLVFVLSQVLVASVIGPNTSMQTACNTSCALNTCTTPVRPFTYSVTSLLFQFVACCEENPAMCVCVFVCLCAVKGRSLSMCCSKRVSASPGWAGLKSVAHWPGAACLHRSAGDALTSDSGPTRGQEMNVYPELW